MPYPKYLDVSYGPYPRGACSICFRSGSRYIRTRKMVWFVCADWGRPGAHTRQNRISFQPLRVCWPEPDFWLPAWNSADGLMTEADRGEAPMAWSDAKLFAYREKMLGEFKQVEPICAVATDDADTLREIETGAVRAKRRLR